MGIDAALDIFQQSGISSIFMAAIWDPATRARLDQTNPLARLPKPFSKPKLLATFKEAVQKLVVGEAMGRVLLSD